MRAQLLILLIITSKLLIGCATSNNLYHYAGAGNKEKVEQLLKSGVNPNNYNSSYTSPIYLASNNGHKHVVKLLIEYGADVRPKGKYGTETPLEIASYMGHLDVVKLLIENGANSEEYSESTLAAFSSAAAHGHLEIVKYLEKSALDLDKKIFGITVREDGIFHAARNGHLEIVSYLVESMPGGIDINSAIESYDETILHISTANKFPRIIKYFLAQGGDKDIRNSKGDTALDVAYKNKLSVQIDISGLKRGIQFEESNLRCMRDGLPLGCWSVRTGVRTGRRSVNGKFAVDNPAEKIKNMERRIEGKIKEILIWENIISLLES